MKVNVLEAHDRLKYLIKDQSEMVSQGCEECLKRNPLSLALQDKCPYIYIFAFPKTHENGVDKVLFWDPRISKPKAQTNSYLFRAKSHTDILEICWKIPPREMWPQYKKGNVTEDEIVNYSINMFENNREELEKPFPDDLSEEKARMILKEIVDQHLFEIRQKKMFQKSYGSKL